jgi:hypothetical protein
MKKVYKLKESDLRGLITKIVTEQNASAGTVTVAGEIGVTPTYDGLKKLFKEFKLSVEASLRKETPLRVKYKSMSVKKSGNGISLSVELEQCKPEERYWFFDLAGAMYSNDSSNGQNIKSAVSLAIREKHRKFTGTPPDGKGIFLLGQLNVFLKSIKGIDPKDPEKLYTLYVECVGAIKADDYMELADEEPKTTVQPQTTTPPVTGQPQK